MVSYLDPRSGETFPLDAPRWCGPFGAPLLLTPTEGMARDRIHRAIRSLWRYRAALPFVPRTPITLGEGCTPLIPHRLAGTSVLLKCEWMMPTGSFKDRGASVMLSLLREQGIDAVLEDSSGNGGAAVAAYAAAGGLSATIMAPDSTSPAKTIAMRACGATVELIPGTRQDTADAAMRRSETVFYASHNWHPFFLQGTKTLAFELWEDLGFTAPDNVIVPCGAGSNVLGCGIGFTELLRAGEIATLPRIFAAQPANCAPIAASFLAGVDTPVPGRNPTDHRRRHRDREADPAAGSARRAQGNPRRRGHAGGGRDPRGHARPRPRRSLCRAHLGAGRRRLRQAARRRHHHRRAAHRAGADRQRAEGDRGARRAARHRPVTLDDLPTPCLVLDRTILQRNIDAMNAAVARHGVALRPHMKTAKSIDVARLALAGQPRGITVSTLAEAEYFAAHGIIDCVYAVGITPQKLDEVARLNGAGAAITVITDDADMARAIAAHPSHPSALIEIDTGEGRGGLAPDDPALDDVAARLGAQLAGVITHAGHSYGARTPEARAAIAETERAGAVAAAVRLRALGHACSIVSVGSSPTALHGARFDGVTELRAGVYQFGDLFQSQIDTHPRENIALTVLASVIGRRPAAHRLLLDAGAIALSKDRSTEAAPVDYGFGLVLDSAGEPSLGRAIVARAYQEHGVVDCDPSLPFPDLPIGARLRVAPNHACLTAAAHDRYYVVEGSDEVIAVWPRVNGW